MNKLKNKFKPVCTRDHRAAEGNKEDQHDESAPTTGAGKSPPKTETVL